MVRHKLPTNEMTRKSIDPPIPDTLAADDAAISSLEVWTHWLHWHRPGDSDRGQALMRLGLGTAIAVYLAWGRYAGWVAPDHDYMFRLIGVFYLVAGGLLLWGAHDARHLPLQRAAGITIDMAALSFLFAINGKAGSVLIAVYVWILVGNASRYGLRYLALALASGIPGFLIAMQWNEYWRDKPAIAAGVLVTMIVVPIYSIGLQRKLAQANAKLAVQYQKTRERALHDHLTGLPNRALLLESLATAMAAAERYNKKLAVLFIDLDGFKLVNDSFGHDAGDLVLREVGSRIRDAVRQSDLVARFGGDEFVVVVPELNGPDEAEIVARHVANAVAPEIPMAAGRTAGVTASIGIATYPHTAQTASALLRRADEAMYTAKRQGKNGWVLAAQTQGG